jgi:hypothetical protein
LVKLKSGQFRKFQEDGITLGENVAREKEKRKKELISLTEITEKKRTMQYRT